MLITTMYSRVVRLTGTSTYTQANFLEDLNEVKNKFWSKIVTKTSDDDRHYQEWLISGWTIAWQSEYTLVSVASSSEWTKLLKWVAINYDWDTYTNTGLLIYKKAREVNRQTLEHEWNYYLENQTIEDPIFFIADNSIFIAPVPLVTNIWVNRLKLTWIRNIIDYTIITTEAEMIIPSDYQEVLLLWVIPYALMTKRVDNNEIVKAQQDYNNAEAEALMNLSSRIEWPTIFRYPEEQYDEIILNRK